MRMNGADALLRSLEAEGVDTVFGIPGGAILPTYEALARGTSIRHALARHEQGGGGDAAGDFFARPLWNTSTPPAAAPASEEPVGPTGPG